MTATKVSIVGVACAVAAVAARQAPPEPPRFRVAVDAVSIDAVVTDREGKVVRDLAAGDFEVFQSGRRQRVTLAQFVPIISGDGSSPVGSPAVPARQPAEVPLVPVPPLAREQVGRTIVLVADDLGLSGQGLTNLLQGLRRFVDTGMLPTDLVAIVRTGQSNGLLQSLTNDRRALVAAIDALRYNILSRKGPSPLGDVVQLGEAAPYISGSPRLGSMLQSLSALNLVVKAARDLPGRKTVILGSEGFGLASGTPETFIEQDPRVLAALDRVIDQATRSGVVIYTIDCQGLETGGLRASDDIHWMDPRDSSAGGVLHRLSVARRGVISAAQQSLAYLAEPTGGFAVVNTNDLGAGLARIGNDARDYYVIGYEPDRDTFAPQGKSPRRHTISVKVRRPGVRVKTRQWFIGQSDPEPPSSPPTPAEELVRAALSPFTAATIPLQATHLPGYSPERGMFVRTVLHLDAHALAFSTDANGTRVTTVDLVGLVLDTDGAQVHNISTGFDVTLTNAAAEQAIENGLVYTRRVPIEKPGDYQLRFAVRDRHSGAIGSAGGFVNVPDVTGGVFALSGLVLRAGEGAATNESIDSDRFSVRPADALRVYAPGTPLSYSYEVYNAGKSVQVVTSLWRGADKLTALPPDTLLPSPDGGPFAGAGRLTLADDLPTGAYMLQIAATSGDPKRAKRARSAVQRLSFDVK